MTGSASGRLAPLNRLGILDWETFDQVARQLARERFRQGLPPKAHEPTYDGFKAIHRHLFQDVFVWAGQERTQQSGNSQARRLFADPSEIGPRMQAAFEAFRRQDELRGLDTPEFARRAARFVSGINEAHPFIDGNGRTQRAWLALVAERAGYTFSLRPGDRDAWNSAARKAFNTHDPEHMALLIEARITVIGPTG